MTLQEILDGLANLGRLRLEREQQKFVQPVHTVGVRSDNNNVLSWQGTTETVEKGIVPSERKAIHM